MVAADASSGTGVRDQARLIGALTTALSVGGSRVEVVETHISYVLLTGPYAYKIKKAVGFGFLDFTTLPLRKRFCEQELRLNRRLAPGLYLDVVAITGTVERPQLDGQGCVLDYAVKMREFPQEALASELLARNALSGTDIDALASQVAAFHASVGRADPGSTFGRPEVILAAAMQNFAQLRLLGSESGERTHIDALAAWTENEYLQRQATLRARQQDGFVRECHGDLHLGNIARVDGRLTIFDCIEFNDGMRWIDVMSEVAFTVMDLDDRSRPDLARRFLNRYLEITGDYAGLAVLPFYRTYRALVRAKIHRLRAAQLEGGPAQSGALAEYRGYVDLARSYTGRRRAGLILTHGPSGCGKTALSQRLLEVIEAVRIRSDVERKRLRGVGPLQRSTEGIGRGLYTLAATDATYHRAHTLARKVLSAGFVTVVDATFLQRWHRDLFRKLSAELRVPFVIVSFLGRESTLRERITRRAAEGDDASDADLAVLEHQLRAQQPFGADERADVVEFDTERSIESAGGREAWRGVIDRLAPTASE